jgi:hypothetical protein
MSGKSNMGDGHGQNISMYKFGFIYEERVQYWKISVKYDRIVYKVRRGDWTGVEEVRYIWKYICEERVQLKKYR